ncbi:phage head closure protein, partial [Proteus mirabilis]|uniref:phage head closure protein n=1 Tax=Proteus mirabilis TaxID=584 RepID=UPI0013CFC7CF
TVGDWVEQFQCAASIKPKFGTEAVTADRLTGTNTYVVTVRYSSQSKVVTTDWRARNVRTGEILNIRSITDPHEQRQWLE